MLAPRRRGTLILVACLATLFVANAVLVLKGSSGNNSLLTFDPWYDLKGMFILEGLPFLGFIHNQAVPTADLLIGFGVAVFSGCALALFFLSRSQERFDAGKYIALLSFGTATALAICLGRHDMSTVGHLAASRYATAALPAALGFWGLLAISTKYSRLARNAMMGVYPVAMVAIIVTNYSEAQIAVSRAQYNLIVQNGIRDGKILTDPNATNYVHAEFLPFVGPDREFLKARKLSVFRTPS
jgi:hypothetical protein